MKNILARIWAVWGLLVFIATLLIFVGPVCATFLIPEPRGIRVFGWLTRWWMRIFLTSIGCVLRISGRHHFSKGKNYVVVANHQSLMDVPLLTPFLPGGNKTIAKKSMARVPFFGWVYTRGSVLVDRHSEQSRRHSFLKMQAVLQQGMHMLLYPEGTRNRTGKPLKSFYDGAFKLAISTQKDVIPVCVFGTAKALPIHQFFYLWPTVFRVYILPPISVAGQNSDSLKALVYNKMWHFIEEKNRPQ